MKKFISQYINPNEKYMNLGLINKEYDDDLVDCIIDCCRSLEVLHYIKFVGYEYITNEIDINTSEYIDARSRGKSNKKEPIKYMYLQDSRYGELILHFQLNCNGEEATVTKKILVPVPDKQGYYLINGTKYFLLWQIVDNSTYTTKRSLTLKSILPVSLKMKQVSYKTIKGVEYTSPIYTINIFKKDANIMLFYLASFGLKKTLRFFSMDKLIRFISCPNGQDETKLTFSISSKMYLEVDKYFFEKYNYTKTIAFMLLTVMTNRLTFENLYSKDYWIEAIGMLGTTNKINQYEKGLNTLTFFDRIIDDTTKRILKVNTCNKRDIYTVIRWLISNFNELRKKDNLSLDNKRLRCNEYIASLLTKAFSERVNRIISMGNKATIKNVKEIFKFPGDILIQQLHRSGLLRYDDRVNDQDFWGKLKTTTKGPNSLGGNNDNNIAVKYRGIHTSFIGRLDINVCGTSDPGTSALLTPFCETYGLYFNPSMEPESFKYNFDKELYKWDDDNNIGLKFKDKDGYYKFCNDIENKLKVERVYDDTHFKPKKYVIGISYHN